jgi:hypothetical protein
MDSLFMNLKTQSHPIIFHNDDELKKAVIDMEYNHGKQAMYVKFLREYVAYMRDDDPEKAQKQSQLHQQEARLSMADHDVHVMKQEMVKRATSQH